jgi:V/A-type H+-transporting ATPase subunit E
MTAEKIIERIKKDSEKEIKQILKLAEEQVSSIFNEAKKVAKQESEKILSNGKKQSENIKRIIISKANQDAKIEIMKAQEKLIEECFTKAHHKLSILDKAKYKKIVTKLMEEGCRKLGGHCNILGSRDVDREIARNKGLSVIGNVETAGGIIIKSNDGKITLDYTFDGILKRRKDEIRRKVGTLLFSEGR